MFDILIIGGGWAGTIAAIAAKRQGASVALASRSWGVTALSNGALDIASTPAFSPVHSTARTLSDYMKDIVAHRPRHPYGILGIEQATKALGSGYNLLAKALHHAQLDAGPLDMAADNVGLPSSLGTLLPAAGAMAPHRGFSLAKPSTWGVLQLAGDGYFDAQRVCRGLQRDAEAFYGNAPNITPIAVPFGAGAAPMAVARSLDDRANCEILAKQLHGKLRGVDGLLASPTLGFAHHAKTRAWLSESCGVPVVEVLGHLPSVPGVRLQRAPEAMLQKEGIAQVGEGVSVRSQGGQVKALITHDSLTISAGAFVLATGCFISGGVTWGQTFQEALFGLPVVTKLGWLGEDSLPRLTHVTGKPFSMYSLSVVWGATSHVGSAPRPSGRDCRFAPSLLPHRAQWAADARAASRDRASVSARPKHRADRFGQRAFGKSADCWR